MKYEVTKIRTERQPVYNGADLTGYEETPYCYLTWTLDDGQVVTDAFVFDSEADDAALTAAIEDRFVETIEPAFARSEESAISVKAIEGRVVEVEAAVLRAAVEGRKK